MTILIIIFSLFAFFLGACIGSFINVYVYRDKEQISGTFSGRSFCPKCKTTLRWNDLIPVISYVILLRGKCRTCKVPIPKQYLIVELVFGAIFLFLFFAFHESILHLFLSPISPIFLINGILLFVFITTLMMLALYDFRYYEIPVLPTLFLALVGLAMIPLEGDFSLALYTHCVSLVIAILFFGSQVFLSRERWMGRGDLYIGIALAFVLTWQQFLLMIISSYCIGAVFGIWIIAKGKKHQSHLPLVPLLAAGTIFTLTYGDVFIRWYAGLIGY